jgi:hypothetical protein
VIGFFVFFLILFIVGLVLIILSIRFSDLLWGGILALFFDLFILVGLVRGYQDYTKNTSFVKKRLEKGAIEITTIPTKDSDSEVLDSDKSIPKVTCPLDAIPDGERCMVSRLPIHMEMDNLVVCPHCLGIAKAELLKEWLKEEHTCPVCQKPLQMNDCPKIILEEKSSSKRYY